MVITFANTGVQTAFLSRCGAQPLVLTQQLVNDAWTGGVQNFMCPVSTEPGPVQVAAGASLQVLRFFSDRGHYRFLVSVGTTPDLRDAEAATSNAVDIP